jgi:pilus assembly protein CpaB
MHAAAISPARFAQIENARVQVPIQRGEALLAAHIDGLGSRVFSTILKKGMRALTLEVDDISSTAGMLRPGDRVDLIYSVKTQDQTPGGGERILFPLMSDVSVLATGQAVTKQDAKGAERRYTNVTLEVSAEDANRILLAKSTGELTAILRSPDDDKHNGGAVLTPDALIPINPGRLPQHPGPAAPRPAPCIEFLIGGAGDGGRSGCASLER